MENNIKQKKKKKKKNQKVAPRSLSFSPLCCSLLHRVSSGAFPLESRPNLRHLLLLHHLMDDGGQREGGRHRIDVYKMAHTQWNNMTPQQNALLMSRKITSIYAERDAAIEERDRAVSEKKSALDERDLAIQQRDAAIAERDNAIRERDNAIAALQFQETTMNGTFNKVIHRGTKRMNYPASHLAQAIFPREVQVADAIPISVVSSDASKSRPVKRIKEGKSVTCKTSKSPRKGKKVGEDLNRHVTTDGSKAEWDAQDLGFMNLVNFDESTMPGPVCTCTGVPRPCYKWGNGGWQSACCTTTISIYPLPQMPNKRHARMGGRKMSGSVFTRLLSRLAAAGHDLSIPIDLKNHWAKHGTNRYITIK